MARIDSLESLRAIYGAPNPRSLLKQLDRLDAHCRTFIGLSPFLVLATQGPDGFGDATPRGDQPGFVSVLDDRTLVIPDRPGNRRVDALSNIVANPAVGLLFLIPGFDETLRINGTAVIDDDMALRESLRVADSLPATVLVVTVREAYLQCGKALMRSKLWAEESRVDRSRMPSLGEILKDQTRVEGKPETQAEMIERYRRTLY